MSYSDAPPPPPPPDQPQYGAPPPGGAAAGSSSKALWSMVLGILSLFCCGVVLGIIAIVLSRGAQGDIARTGQGGAGMAKAGFILGIIGVVLGILQIILFATGTWTFDTSFETSG